MPDADATDAMAELQRRTRQQAIVAAFGRFALRENDLAALMQEAARVAAEGLGATFAKVLEHEPSRIRWWCAPASAGGLASSAMPASARRGLPRRLRLATGTPSFSNDLAADHRFGLHRYWPTTVCGGK